MAKAIEAGLPKLRIEEAAARTQARIDSGAQPSSASTRTGWRRGPPLEVLRVDNRGVARRAVAKLAAAARRPGSGRGRRARWRAHPAPPGRRAGPRQPAGPGGRRRPGQGHRRRDLRCPGEGVRPAHRVRTISGVYRAEVRRGDGDELVRGSRGRCVRRGRGPAAADPGRQDGPGRPRPRPEGDRHAPSPTSASTSTSGRCSPPPTRSPSRPSTTTCTSSGSARWPPGTSPWSRAARRAGRAGPRRHPDRRRRRDPAGRLHELSPPAPPRSSGRAPSSPTPRSTC